MRAGGRWKGRLHECSDLHLHSGGAAVVFFLLVSLRCFLFVFFFVFLFTVGDLSPVLLLFYGRRGDDLYEHRVIVSFVSIKSVWNVFGTCPENLQ